MKTNNAILIGAALAVAGYFAYRYFRKKQKQNNEKKDVETEPNKDNQNNRTGYSEYQKKVMEIQSILGVMIDGIAGPQTNGALNKKAPVAYKTYGVITAKNIDFYLALLKGPANLIF